MKVNDLYWVDDVKEILNLQSDANDASDLVAEIYEWINMEIWLCSICGYIGDAISDSGSISTYYYGTVRTTTVTSGNLLYNSTPTDRAVLGTITPLLVMLL